MRIFKLAFKLLVISCPQSLIDTAIENSVNHYKQFVHNANITESVKVSLSEEDVALLNKITD